MFKRSTQILKTGTLLVALTLAPLTAWSGANGAAPL